MDETLLIGIAAVLSAVANIIEARRGGKATRAILEHLCKRTDRLEQHVGLPPIPTDDSP